jgi:hypothetical protein
VAITSLDAGVLIGFLNSRDAHHRDATAALIELARRRDSLWFRR